MLRTDCLVHCIPAREQQRECMCAARASSLFARERAKSCCGMHLCNGHAGSAAEQPDHAAECSSRRSSAAKQPDHSTECSSRRYPMRVCCDARAVTIRHTGRSVNHLAAQEEEHIACGCRDHSLHDPCCFQCCHVARLQSIIPRTTGVEGHLVGAWPKNERGRRECDDNLQARSQKNHVLLNMKIKNWSRRRQPDAQRTSNNNTNSHKTNRIKYLSYHPLLHPKRRPKFP